MKINKLPEWNANIQSNVRNITTNAGTRGSLAKYFSETSMFYFLDNGIENPSVAKIIASDEINKGGLLARIRFFNKYYSEKSASYRKAFEDRFSELYPKTGALRDKLINNNRIVLNGVKSKASKLAKILMFAKL